MCRNPEFWLLVVICAAGLLLAAFALGDLSVQAAPSEPEACVHVATADTIRVYYCEDINLFVNQFGFMAFEP